MIIDPRGMTAVDWCSQMTLGLDKYGAIPAIRDGSEWRRWANIVVQLPAAQLVQAPFPESFETWEQWAIRFCQKAESLL